MTFICSIYFYHGKMVKLNIKSIGVVHMNILVTYKSKTGFTEKYARWISEELSADLHPLKDVNTKFLEKYDIIIHGGSLYAGNILGLSFYKENKSKIKNKHLVVFAVGSAPHYEASHEKIMDHNFPEASSSDYIKLFYLRGGLNFSKLGFVDKFLLKSIKRKLLKKQKSGIALKEGEQGLLAGFDGPVDYTDKSSIKPLIKYVKSIK